MGSDQTQVRVADYRHVLHETSLDDNEKLLDQLRRTTAELVKIRAGTDPEAGGPLQITASQMGTYESRSRSTAGTGQSDLPCRMRMSVRGAMPPVSPTTCSSVKPLGGTCWSSSGHHSAAARLLSQPGLVADWRRRAERLIPSRIVPTRIISSMALGVSHR